MTSTLQLGQRDATATIAVKNLAAARAFYAETLGLAIQQGGEEGVLDVRSGNTHVVIYESPNGGQNPATSVTWAVGDDFEAVMDNLHAKGVVFEHYDLPGLTLRGDVHVAGSFKGAWFKDPDGNILHVLNR